MKIFQIFIELITLALYFHYPVWWLLFSWLIWLLLKWRNWPRPSISIMLIYSAAIGISYIKLWYLPDACSMDPRCDPYPSLSFPVLPFLAEVSFWLMVLYVPIALALRPGRLFEQKRDWWIALFIIAFAVMLIISREWASILTWIYILRDITYLDLITTDFYFYPVMGILVPWFIWLLLGILERSRPALPTMLMYSISVANPSSRLWIEAFICKMQNLCEVDFSLLLFIGEIALWFIPLYGLMKLITRQKVELS